MKKLNNRVRQTLFALTLVLFVTFLYDNFLIVVNHSESLPINFVILQKGKIPTARDQIFVFKVRNNPQYQMKEINFIKLVGGFPGDKIEVKGGDFITQNKLLKGEKIGDDSIYHSIRFLEIIDSSQLKKKNHNLTDKEVFVAGKRIGTVKPFSKKMFAELEFYKQDKSKDKSKFLISKFFLHAVKEEEIPPHKFFAYTPNKDSFDSRYQEIGLIDEKDIIGTAIFTF